MRLIFTSYVRTDQFNDPVQWLKRIEGFTGILESLAHSHDVISIERINYEGEYEQNGVRYIFRRQRSQTARFPFRMHRLIKGLKPDIVFVNGFIFPLQIIQLKLKLGREIKIIVINQAEKPFVGVKGFLQSWADRYVDAYLFGSLEFAEMWTRNANISDASKIHEVLHGSSVFKPGDKITARSALSVTGSPVFLWVGRLDANKDPLTVVKAFMQFLRHQPSAKLYMIYHTEDLLLEIRELLSNDEKAARAITLVGKIAHDELQRWYDSADFIISGSHYEGGGIAVCEALSCGCIPLLTDIIAFRKMTGPGKCGILYQPGNENELLKALLKTMTMNPEQEREKVLRQFAEELSFDAIAKKINKLIARITSPTHEQRQ
jgi:glycosyltransferase involved in cell wall biosynthesis